MPTPWANIYSRSLETRDCARRSGGVGARLFSKENSQAASFSEKICAPSRLSESNSIWPCRTAFVSRATGQRSVVSSCRQCLRELSGPKSSRFVLTDASTRKHLVPPIYQLSGESGLADAQCLEGVRGLIAHSSTVENLLARSTGVPGALSDMVSALVLVATVRVSVEDKMTMFPPHRQQPRYAVVATFVTG